MRTQRLGCVLLALAAPVCAQELLWTHGPNSDNAAGVALSFGDLDRDGSDDLLVVNYANTGTLQERLSLRIYSGRDGTILDDRLPTRFLVYGFNGVGDFDLDGYPDYAVNWQDVYAANTLEIWSPHLQRRLIDIPGTASSGFAGAGAFTRCINLDGDGLPDIAVGTTHPSFSTVQAYDHFGNLLWGTHYSQVGRLVLTVRGIDDLDGDGRSEVLVGGTDYNLGFTRGCVSVLSGATGAMLRITYDRVRGDIIGYPLTTAGDMDRDGIEDYATGNYWGGGNVQGNAGRKMCSVYSGATGAIIRDWLVANYDLGSHIIGGRDCDLDGVVDVIPATHAYPNVPHFRQGRVEAFSSRDLQLLAYTEPRMETYLPYYADSVADLGVQTGNPYPVFALVFPGRGVGPGYGIEVWRTAPPGQTFLGAECSSNGNPPTIGVRRMQTSQGERCRVVLGSAPPGALAFCVAAARHESQFAGSPLPYALDNLGFPGCSLHVPPTLIDTQTVGTQGFDRGYAGIDIPMRLDPAGFGAAVQWLVFDFTTGAYAATQRCEIRLR